MRTKWLFQIEFVDTKEVRLCVAHDQEHALEFIADEYVDSETAIVRNWSIENKIGRGEILIDDLNLAVQYYAKLGLVDVRKNR